MDPLRSAALLGNHDQVHPQMVDGDLQYDDGYYDGYYDKSDAESGDDDSGKDDDEDYDADDDMDEVDNILDQEGDEEIHDEENDKDNDFHYEQLDLTKQQIRLVAIKPTSSSGNGIECDMHVFDANNAPYYVTLSYTWGPPSPTKTILVNGKHFTVRQNLYDFLLAFRDDLSNVQYIWIDQLCISQAHTGERNHQVRMMSQIYSRCLHVIIWLAADSLAAVSLFMNKPSFRHASLILEDRYFRRLWVVQEIFLSPEARVLCGATWISWDAILHALGTDPEKEFLPNLSMQTHCMNFKEALLMQTSSRQGRTLIDCLRLFMRQECEDDRDRVYGLLGLVDRGPCPHVDYRKNALGVFLDVVQTISLDEWQTESQVKESHEGRAEGTLIKLLTEVIESMGLRVHQQTLILIMQNVLYDHIDTQPESVFNIERRSFVREFGFYPWMEGFEGDPLEYNFGNSSFKSFLHH
jgi:hypothetical protein